MPSWKKILVEGDAATDNIGSADQTVSGNRDLDLGSNTFTISAGSPGTGENQQGISMAEDSAFTITSPSFNIKSDGQASSGELRIEGILGYYSGFKANVADSSNTVYTLPNGSQNPPSTGDSLICSSTGNLSWAGRLEKENPTASGAFTINNVADGVTGQARLQIEDYSGGQYVNLDAPNSVSSNYTITLPDASPGAANKILESDASGNLSWIDTPSGGSDTNIANANLTADNNRTLDLDANTLTIDINDGEFTLSDSTNTDTYIQAGANVLQLGDSGMVVESDGVFQAKKGIEHDEGNLTTAGAFGVGAEITYLGASASSTTVGNVYYYNGTTWASYTSATEAPQKALLGIALGATMASGFLLKGFVNPNGATGFTAASPVYGGTDASATTTAPTSGYQRVMGHSISTSVIFFNPSQEFIDLA